MRVMQVAGIPALVAVFCFAACSAELSSTEAVGTEAVGTAQSAVASCTGVFCPSRSHCEIGANGFPTCVGDQPICGGVQCAPFSVCCNSGCANPFCFSGSGACPPVPCH
jgi:hypothetical protein